MCNHCSQPSVLDRKRSQAGCHYLRFSTMVSSQTHVMPMADHREQDIISGHLDLSSQQNIQNPPRQHLSTSPPPPHFIPFHVSGLT